MGGVPSYKVLAESGELDRRIEAADELTRSCRLCPRACGVNRMEGELGFCRTAARALVSSHGPHFGEERPLVGKHGSGTIFFTNCNLGCVFCQNYEISHLGVGQPVSPDRLAGMMCELEDLGCHNINVVTPTHVVPEILKALALAVERGLTVPIVYNSGGYDSVETLRILDGIVDIYMPDFKFWDRDTADRFAKAPDYPEAARNALREMHRQVGDLQIGDDGIAVRGLLVRHLVLPQDLAGTEEVVDFLAREISKETYVNVMDQYRPCFRADRYPEINRPLQVRDFENALEMALRSGLKRLDQLNYPRQRYRIIRW